MRIGRAKRRTPAPEMAERGPSERGELRNPRQVQSWLVQRGSPVRVEVLPAGTATAVQAASALGVPVARIAKSLVVESSALELQPSRFAVAVIPGQLRLNLAAVSALWSGAASRLMPARKVKAVTGYPIGGVCPFRLPAGLEVLVDTAFPSDEYCYLAAGHPTAVLRIGIAELINLTGARVVEGLSMSAG